jgi:hypothetical protein
MDENNRIKNTPPQEPIFLKTDTPSLQEPIFLDGESVQKADQCVICLENMDKKNSCTTECGHRFCCDCLLRSAQTNTNCPLCRHQLIPPPPPKYTQEDIEEGYEQGYRDGKERVKQKCTMMLERASQEISTLSLQIHDLRDTKSKNMSLRRNNAFLQEKIEQLQAKFSSTYREKVIPRISNMPIPPIIYFKSHPDSQDAIMEASKQLQGEGDKKPGQPIGKVKGGDMVWSALSDDEKNIWKIRAQESEL